MRDRCNNPRNGSYANYGGRGITVDPRWDNFLVFLADMGTRPSPGHSIERRDNDKGYGPDNCYWATRSAQAGNRRNCMFVDFQGETVNLKEAARRSGIAYGTLYHRFKQGYPPERLFAGSPLIA